MASNLRSNLCKRSTPAKQEKKKMQRFNPEIILEGVQTKLNLMEKLQAACDALIEVASEVMDSPEVTTIMSEIDDTKRELLLVACLGYYGAKEMKLAVRLIPVQYCGLRNSKICCMINKARSNHSEPPIEDTKIEKLLTSATITAKEELILSGQKYRSTDEGHSMFLAPPVSWCINPTCIRCGQANSLSTNHDPIDVVVFDFDGPLLGLKVCLKCKSCSTIYNYSKFGKKYTDGERFYEKERDLIEITDRVYATKSLYSFYRCLW